jgi:acetyl/propionyl-CoA carboxylase alpha subunit
MPEQKIKKVLVANRGVPAVRIMNTCRDKMIKTVAIYSTPDRLAYHVFLADEAVHIGEAPPHDSYLNMDKIIRVAKERGCQAIHPGWGFLAENADFAEREAPSPSIDDDLRTEICFSAIRLARELSYYSAGTIEFLLDPKTKRFYFLEVNTRLQVEHGVTELITGLDIVSLMFDIAEGKRLPFKQDDIYPNRHAIEVRINAEDPRTFNPSFGTITRLEIPQGPGIRVVSGVYEGAEVPPYYDSLIMLVMSAGADRYEAIRVMDRALSRGLRVEGVKTIAPLLLSIIRHPDFISGNFSTRFIEEKYEELVRAFREKTTDDEALKIAQYIAEVSALGPQPWM